MCGDSRSHENRRPGPTGWEKLGGCAPKQLPTFLLTHLHQAGFSNFKEEGLVFLIFLIINYLD